MTNPPTPERDRGDELRDEIEELLTDLELEEDYDRHGRVSRLLAQLDAAESELNRRDTFESCDGCSTGDCPHQSDAECIQAQAEIVREQEARIAMLESLLDEQRAVIERLAWRPIKDHSGLFVDGDAYLVRIPVVRTAIRDRQRNYEYMEYHIVYVSCCSETPVTFKDVNGDTWDPWDWDDLDAYIKLDDLKALAASGGSDE